VSSTARATVAREARLDPRAVAVRARTPDRGGIAAEKIELAPCGVDGRALGALELRGARRRSCASDSSGG
jgi:hypothetical protein